MRSVFESNKEWQLLLFFLGNPGKSFHVNEIVKKTGASAGAVSQVCKNLKFQELLIHERKGNMSFYALNKRNPVNKELNRAYLCFQLEENKLVRQILENIPDVLSVAVFGSRVKGGFECRSDLDLLIIASKKNDLKKISINLGKKMHLDILPVFKTFFEWKKMAEARDPFYLEILSSHILLHGQEIVV